MTSIHPSEDPPLGWLVPCLAVADLRASLEFYDRLAFRGGDVGAIAAGLEGRDGVHIGPEGGESLVVHDPDGRTLLFETAPPERL